MRTTNGGIPACKRYSVYALLFTTTAIAGGISLPAFAQQTNLSGQPCIENATELLPQCEHANAGILINTPIGENTEDAGEVVLPGAGFLISVDGDVIAGDGKAFNPQRLEDIALQAANIQVKFDGLDVSPILNVSTGDVRSSYQVGQAVNFVSSTNYPDWISRAEIRVLDSANKLVALLPTKPNGRVEWHMPATGLAEMNYVLRVYDQRGNYDQTIPLSLTRTSNAYERAAVSGEIVASGFGQDNTAIRNINVYGGSVTVFGENLPAGANVVVLGETVAVDRANKFVVQRILPPGEHAVGVDVHKNGVLINGFEREILIPHNDWFYVALADLTIGHTRRNFIADASGEFSHTYANGRVAFYLKGKIRGEYILTAAADTGDGPLVDIFRNLDASDARSLLRRIDPNEYYPVYGDDSSIVEDAPTSGKLYIRLEKGDSHVMWGNFKTSIAGSDYLQSNRTLYGAEMVYRSEDSTSFGERQTQVVAYAAQPDTTPKVDVFLGTGGSVYFLKRQDISIGSETISIVTRDPNTGRVISTQVLVYGDDYQIDYIQGIVILTHPLNSTAQSGSVVQEGVLGNYSVSLVVQYEYTPTLDDVDDFAFGGRAQHWINDSVRVGVTALSENTGVGTQTSIGADLHVRTGENSFIHAEYAQTQGPGYGASVSSNGGLSIADISTAGTSDLARAIKIHAHADLSDIDPSITGTLGARYEKMEAGFSTLDHEISIDQFMWEFYGTYEPTKDIKLSASFENFEDAAGKVIRTGVVDVGYQINEQLLAEVGLKYQDRTTIGVPAETGTRTDLAVRLSYSFDEDLSVYAFGQTTIVSTGGLIRNDRYGAGASYQLSEKVRITGEVSNGTTGLGGQAMLEYQENASDLYYLGYRLDPGRSMDGFALSGTDNGNIVVGAKHTYNDYLSAFTENNYDMFGARKSLTSTYGVNFTPDAKWSYTGGLEVGKVLDSINGDFNRTALSLGVVYTDEDMVSARARFEGRWEDGVNVDQDITSYLLSSGIRYKLNDDARILANIDAVITNSNQSSLLNGQYVEASIGYAYRPVANDRLNLLFKYSFLYDLPGLDQVSVSGATDGMQQISSILSVDAIYDISEYWSIGAKYGYRRGLIAERSSDVFSANTAHLGVLRTDFNIVHEWDGLLETRALYTEESEIMELGATAALYRHFGNNLKVGVGYNFGNVSSDLRNLDDVESGIFLNVIAKY